MATASKFPIFTPALGHTYLPPAPKPLTSATNTQMSQTSKESTPIPGTQDTLSSKAPPNPKSLSDDQLCNPQLLQDSLNTMLRYGHEYMDETPILGEPGSFIINKPREAQQPASQLKPKPNPIVSKPTTPQIITDVLPPKQKDSLGAEKSPTSAVTRERKARRKSRPAGSTTTPK